MELYTLDSGFNKSKVIDQYISAIWTERYSEAGDFVLTLPPTIENRQLLLEGTRLSIPESDRVMVVSSQELKDNVLRISGNSLEQELEFLLVIPADALDAKTLTLIMPPKNALNELVWMYATNGGWVFTFGGTEPVGVDGVSQTIPNLTVTGGGAGTSETFSVDRGPLYSALKDIAQASNIGFKLTPANVTPSDYDLEFISYLGRDLTSAQSINPIVRFSPALDSLANVSELRSRAKYCTVAYVITPDFDPATLPSGTAYTGIAYAYPGADLETGFTRRAVLTEASGINADSVNNTFATYQAMLDRLAKDTLANNNFTRVLDGEVVPQSQYKFGTDYLLGDIIELQDVNGFIQTARITEYIRTQDVNGFREYPTVSVIE